MGVEQSLFASAAGARMWAKRACSIGSHRVCVRVCSHLFPIFAGYAATGWQSFDGGSTVHILLVEDEQRLARLTARALAEERHQVDLAHEGTHGLEMALVGGYDLIVLDVMLPGLDGLTVCREARDAGIRTPILMLTARGSTDDRVRGLDAGADDYLVKPFASAELLARVRALGRRPPLDTGLPAHAPTMLEYAGLTMDFTAHTVTRAGAPIELTAKEFALLEYLLRNAGRVLTRTQILEHVWEYDFEPESNVVDIYVYYLRRKIEKPFGSRLIQSVRGVGYSLRWDRGAAPTANGG